MWYNAVLEAPDQLRHRVAWALSQIFVASEVNNGGINREAWGAYYDIFVQHAFGNYGDIVREVAASGVMAKCVPRSRLSAKPRSSWRLKRGVCPSECGATFAAPRLAPPSGTCP